MNNNKLAEVENFLSSASVFDFLETLDADSALDSRDEPEFDDAWMKEFNSLKNESFDADDIEYINSLREKAFKLSFRVINNSEISSRISDDFELIAKSVVIGKDNNWAISYLWSSYKGGKFPQ
ncbi:hypothetical protein AI2839V1_1138 [Enterobacter cloacae]|uniref:Uncharacterized protein n=1 Tax=Enterobacter sichuanensis TaxID=2071710 RepID=A0AAE4DYI4_9ENTR|nr:hypothetical protein [Enterobacter sichuanensis]MDR9948028.1 hypothetical protein [Enterobacter sichuanensis]CAF2428837.1 hypothetical protein AI2839V1_1138 [Enterobacter cloacae]CAH5149012.1 hypothetical protein AI2839V1_1138 [Enterobacter cloacae]